MSTVDWGPGVNAEAIAAWDGPLFDRFVRFRHILTTGLGAHGNAAMQLVPPQPGERVIDIGCGFGDTAQQIGALVGPTGHVLGVDAAERFIEAARAEAEEAGADNVSFEVADVQAMSFDAEFDLAFSRMGTMFFVNPGAAMRCIRQALVPGGRLVMVVWRRREDNEWIHRAQRITESIVQKPEEYDEPTCGPGPFSMANADTVSDILRYAGFTDIALHRSDIPILVGRSVDEAVELAMALGPAGEILRLQGERIAHLVPTVRDALTGAYGDLVTDDGVMAAASTWIVTARVPG